ncbi:MAG: polysaccharide biosynthesis tyrosine autokinase [Limisphaerales bacterium]
MNKDETNGETPPMNHDASAGDGSSQPRHEGNDSSHAGRRERGGNNGGDGATPRVSLEASRAAEYGLDPYGGGLMASRNRFQETSQLLAKLHRYELALRKHWWILVLALCVSIGPAAYHVITTPASYQSIAKLWLSGKLEIKESQLYSEELSSFMGTQVELLKSSTVFNQAFTNILKAHPDWSSMFTNYTSEEHKPFKLTVTDFPKAAVIEVKAVGKNPGAVREFLNSLMEEYQAFRKGVREQKTDVTLSSITEQVNQQNLEVQKQQERLQRFLASNNVVLLQEQGSSAGAYAAKLSKQLASLRTEMKLLELISPEQLAQAGKSRVAPEEDANDAANSTAGQGAANELMNTLAGPQADFFRASQQIQLYKAKREELLEFLQSSHPKILKLDESIAEQEKIVEVFKRQSVTQMGDRRAAISLQITNLEVSASEWEAKALDATRKMADYQRIQDDLKRTQGLYEKLLGVIQQVDVNRTLDQENVRVMDAASAPKPVRRTLLFLGLGLSAGLFLGLGLLYTVSLFDDRFASLSELGSQVPETVIGQIPDVGGRRRRASLNLVQPDDDRHAFAESFRNMRSWVLFSCEKSKQPKMLMITSSVPLEGKSTICSNLAVTLALSGARVLLIDADLRRAGLDDIFEVSGESGFADILEQGVSYRDVIKLTKTRNLWLLPAGSGSTNPGELFLGPSCDIFLRKIRTQYDYVLLDSAPVLATDDTANLASGVDAVLFVVRADFTSARNARAGLQMLRERHANVLGIVFNRSVATYSGGYYSYYGYSKYYYHGSYGKRRSKTKPTAPPAETAAAPKADTDKPA